MNILSPEIEVKNKVFFLKKVNNSFEDIYLKVRKAENRIYDKESLKKLPYIEGDKEREWKMRAETLKAFKSYISKKENLKILDIGCGNGWFAHSLSELDNTEIYAVDLNQIELEQGANTFESKKLKFIYADIFDSSSDIFKGTFNIIYLAASIQYFPDLNKLIERISSFLLPNGEIHILDSPFYKKNEIAGAKKRSIKYYTSLGFKEMAHHYFHQSYDRIELYNPKLLYSPSLYNRILKNRKNPFPWIMIKP